MAGWYPPYGTKQTQSVPKKLMPKPKKTAPKKKATPKPAQKPVPKQKASPQQPSFNMKNVAKAANKMFS